MSSGANADDNIKCLLKGDSQYGQKKLDERPEPGNNDLIWFSNAAFHPLMGEEEKPAQFQAALNITAF